MHTLAHANAITVNQTADLWHLQRNGQTLAVIERSWDDRIWFVFLADASGQLVFNGAPGRLAALKTCLRLWARRHTGHLAPFFRPDPQPE